MAQSTPKFINDRDEEEHEKFGLKFKVFKSALRHRVTNLWKPATNGHSRILVYMGGKCETIEATSPESAN